MTEYEFKIQNQSDGSFWIACQHLVGLKWLPIYLSPKTDKQLRKWLSLAHNLLGPDVADALYRQAFEDESVHPIRFKSGTAEMLDLGCMIPQSYSSIW
jgi:hypothetical protein